MNNIEKELTQSFNNFVHSEKPSENLKQRVLHGINYTHQSKEITHRPLKRRLIVSTMLISMLVCGTIYAEPLINLVSNGHLFNINKVPVFSYEPDVQNNNSNTKDLTIDQKMKQLSDSTKISKAEVQKLIPIPLALPSYLPTGYVFFNDFGRAGSVTWDVEHNTVSLSKDGKYEYFSYFNKAQSNNTKVNEQIEISYEYNPGFAYSSAVIDPNITNAKIIDGYQTTESNNSINAWVPLSKTALLHVIVTSDSIPKDERVKILKSIINNLPRR
jgi:hypothetical protein